MVYIVGLPAEATSKTVATRVGRPVFPMPIHVYYEMGSLPVAQELQALFAKANYQETIAEDVQRYKQNTAMRY